MTLYDLTFLLLCLAFIGVAGWWSFRAEHLPTQLCRRSGRERQPTTNKIMERERDQYAAMLCDAMRVVYATTCVGDSTDLIDRFESLELTPAISPENA